MQTRVMPAINLTTLNGQLIGKDHEIAARIVGTRGDTKGRLRASKPDTKDEAGQLAAYVWRMVAFQVSPVPQHQCMPCTADFDLPDYCWARGVSYDDHDAIHTAHERRREVVAWLDGIVAIVVDSIPRHEWHGIIRWGQAFGQIGTPQLAPDGAYIYR